MKNQGTEKYRKNLTVHRTLNMKLDLQQDAVWEVAKLFKNNLATLEPVSQNVWLSPDKVF